MSEWTKEPIRLEIGGAKDGSHLLQIEGSFNPSWTYHKDTVAACPPNRGDEAVRLMDCYNACKGIKDPEETVPMMFKTLARMARNGTIELDTVDVQNIKEALSKATSKEVGGE